MENSKARSLIDHRLKVIRPSGQPAGASSFSGAPKPKLLDQVRQAIRTRHYSTPGAQGREHDHGLYACVEPRPAWCFQPGGSPVTAVC